MAGNDCARVLTLAWLNSHFESGLKSPLGRAIMSPEESRPVAVAVDRAESGSTSRASPGLRAGRAPRLAPEQRLIKGAPRGCHSALHVHRVSGATQALTDERRAALRSKASISGARKASGCSASPAVQTLDQATAVPIDEKDLAFADNAVFLDLPKVSAGAALAALN